MKVDSSKHIVDYCLWAIAILVIVSALMKINLLFGLFNFQHLWEKTSILIFFLSVIIGALGLYRFKAWGFISIYVYILMATFIFSISVVPFIFNLLNLMVKNGTLLVFIINLTLLIVTALLQAIRSKIYKDLESDN